MTIAPRVPRESRIDETASRRRSRRHDGAPKPRILSIATSTGQGGIERHAATLAVRAVERGYAVDALAGPSSFFSRECSSAGIPVFPIINRNAADFMAAARIAAVISAR